LRGRVRDDSECKVQRNPPLLTSNCRGVARDVTLNTLNNYIRGVCPDTPLSQQYNNNAIMAKSQKKNLQLYCRHRLECVAQAATSPII